MVRCACCGLGPWRQVGVVGRGTATQRVIAARCPPPRSLGAPRLCPSSSLPVARWPSCGGTTCPAHREQEGSAAERLQTQTNPAAMRRRAHPACAVHCPCNQQIPCVSRCPAPALAPEMELCRRPLLVFDSCCCCTCAPVCLPFPHTSTSASPVNCNEPCLRASVACQHADRGQHKPQCSPSAG